MKKLLFFKSSSSNGGENHEISTSKRDKKHYVETRWKTVVSRSMEKKFRNSEHFSPVSDRKVAERNTISRDVVLRRSRSLSMSSGADENGRLGREDLSELRSRRKLPSISNGAHAPKCDCSENDFQFTGRDSKPEKLHVCAIQTPGNEVLFDRAGSGPSYSSSPRSSSGSTSIPGQVLDLYIDGEHRQEMKLGIGDHHSSKTSGLLKGRSHPSSNFPRDSKSRHESPRKLARDVVEKLLRLEQFCDSKPRYKHLDRHSSFNLYGFSEKGSPCQYEQNLGCNKQSPFLRRECRDLSSDQKEDDTDTVLLRRLEETKERAILLSRELSQDSCFEYYAGNLSASQKSRSQLEEERKLVLEISDQLQCRIAERAAAREAALSVKEEMNSMVLKLEENDELQSCFHRELDRRADEWAFKLQEVRSEELRLRDRVRELAEQNVNLQKEVSSFYTKEQESKDMLSQMEAYLKDITEKMDQARLENEDLQKRLSESQDKLKAAEEIGSCMERNHKEREKEISSLIKSVASLQGTCSQQERTIDGLRQCLNLEAEKQQVSGKLGILTLKLQMEQLRLTEVEQALRRQLETFRVESDSLRHENIYLLERLKGTGKEGGRSGLKLDQELGSYVQCLNDMGLSLLNESTQMCGKLLGVLKSKLGHDAFLETHSLMEYDMKIQGFKQGAQQLERSLGKAASLLREKGEPESCDPDSYDACNGGGFQNTDRRALEDDLKSELKAECLLTSILKEKLYSKEKEVEQLQAELARALRNHDVLKSEIQGALDTISCVNHKMKNLQLQIIEKDRMINQLEGEVRSQGEELSTTKGVLSKVSQERDLMWEEVKQYSEKNMLLNCEMNSLKKKIEALEEDTLLKDGQISILKDSLNNAQPFDPPFGFDHSESFRI